MSVAFLKTDSVNRCARHILDPSHYNPDGSCLCAPVKQLTLKQKEAAAMAYQCPVCQVGPSFPCIHQQSTRKMRLLKFPHPERIRLVDPEYTRKLPKFRQAGNSGKDRKNRDLAMWNTRYAAAGRKQSRKRESYH